MNWVWKSKQRVQVNHSILQQNQEAREKNLKRASLQPIYKPSQCPEMRSTAGSGEKEEAAGKTILSGGRERGAFFTSCYKPKRTKRDGANSKGRFLTLIPQPELWGGDRSSAVI